MADIFESALKLARKLKLQLQSLSEDESELIRSYLGQGNHSSNVNLKRKKPKTTVASNVKMNSARGPKVATVTDSSGRVYQGGVQELATSLGYKSRLSIDSRFKGRNKFTEKGITYTLHRKPRKTVARK